MNKEQAEKQATAFAVEKMKDGEHVTFHEHPGSFTIVHGGQHTIFSFDTLEAGDLCVAWEKYYRDRVFLMCLGYVDGEPRFSMYAEPGHNGDRWSNYEKLGYNVLTKKFTPPEETE